MKQQKFQPNHCLLGLEKPSIFSRDIFGIKEVAKFSGFLQEGTNEISQKRGTIQDEVKKNMQNRSKCRRIKPNSMKHC